MNKSWSSVAWLTVRKKKHQREEKKKYLRQSKWLHNKEKIHMIKYKIVSQK